MFDKTQPLWMPQGSVRAILALLLTISFVVLALKGIASPTDIKDLTVLALGFYFITKANTPASGS